MPAFSRAVLIALLLVPSLLFADKSLEEKACRSVHFWYQTPDNAQTAPGADFFYNEVTIHESAPGTYFMVCGWDKGYYGIQELDRGKKLLLFSVWDSGNNDPNSVPEDQRVKLLHKHPQMRIGRFGNEGSGGQSFFDYDWKIGETYRFMVGAKPAGNRTEYSGYFYHPEQQQWLHLVTFSTITGGKKLGGYYSFVEDFKRNGQSKTQTRHASFSNPYLIHADKGWQPVSTVRFTGDSNPSLNISAWSEQGVFHLATGGDIAIKKTGLNQLLPLQGTPPVTTGEQPMLLQVEARSGQEGNLKSELVLKLTPGENAEPITKTLSLINKEQPKGAEADGQGSSQQRVVFEVPRNQDKPSLDGAELGVEMTVPKGKGGILIPLSELAPNGQWKERELKLTIGETSFQVRLRARLIPAGMPEVTRK